MSSIATNIESAARHSPVHEELDRLRPLWGVVDGMPVALALGDAATERSRAQTLGLCDVSAFARIVLKGPAAAGLLAAQQIAVPADVFGVSPLAQGGLIARTGGAEFFLEDGLEGQTVARVIAAVGSATPACYRVLRQDASFLLSGQRAAELFLQTCGFDFRQPPRRLVMTRVAGVSCSILRREIGGAGAFQLWCDGTYGAYLWRTLMDIVRELDGAAVGAAAFFPELIY
jgi:sarcosine oxidase, subunit gamma